MDQLSNISEPWVNPIPPYSREFIEEHFGSTESVEVLDECIVDVRQIETLAAILDAHGPDCKGFRENLDQFEETGCLEALEGMVEDLPE